MADEHFADPGLSDETVAARARSGARDAFAVLVARYQNRVYRLAFRLSRNRSDAEEIAQEAFLLAHRGIESFHGDSLFRTWLYRITINQGLMHRRAARRRPTQSLETSTPMDWRLHLAAASQEPQEGADELSHRKRVVQRVREAVALLATSHRSALVLRDLEELSSEEAAEILGISPDAVRQRAHRARATLRGQLVGILDAA